MKGDTDNAYETDNTTGKNHGGQAANTPLERLTASSIVGDAIEDAEGNRLGTIDNLLVNLTTCRVEYTVVDFGALLGIGGKLFAVPFAELQIDEDKRAFVINRDQAFLENLPGFDKANWPGPEHAYYEEVNLYWQLPARPTSP